VTRFRLAGPDDVDQVVDLVESAYRGERSRIGWTTEAHLLDGQRVDTPMVRAALADPDVSILLLDDAGDLSACCELRRPDDAGTARFGMFAVSPTRQGAGLGREVLAEAERTARDEWGAARLRMTVIAQRDDLIAWYGRRGYQDTGEHEPFPYGDDRYGRPRRDDLHFVVLEKRLTGRPDAPRAAPGSG
jgi:GNAT superfamily N-acetyltransferase